MLHSVALCHIMLCRILLCQVMICRTTSSFNESIIYSFRIHLAHCIIICLYFPSLSHTTKHGYRRALRDSRTRAPCPHSVTAETLILCPSTATNGGTYFTHAHVHSTYSIIHRLASISHTNTCHSSIKSFLDMVNHSHTGSLYLLSNRSQL